MIKHTFYWLLFIEEEESEKEVPPEFRSLIRDNYVMKGEPATFDCQVSGLPKPQVHWEKVNKITLTICHNIVNLQFIKQVGN